MKVHRLYMHNPLRNFTYIVEDEVSKDGIVVDPNNAKRVIEYAEEIDITISKVVTTHGHPDHVQGVDDVLNHFNGEKLLMADGESLPWGDSEFSRIDTPGHTMDHCCFLVKNTDKQVLISGDTLFNAGVGHCKLGGDPEVLFETTQRVRIMDPEIILYPGHDYLLNNLKFTQTHFPKDQEVQKLIKQRELMNQDSEFITLTLGDEFRLNPFFRLSELIGMLGENEKEVFLKLRSLRDVW